VTGNFATTSLDYSTITINGSASNDTVDISGLTSDHRVACDSNGGTDTVVGTPSPQDVFGTSDGLDVLTDMACGLSDLAIGGLCDEAAGRGMVEAGAHADRTMADSVDDLQPLDLAEATQMPSFMEKTFADACHGRYDRRIAPADADYLLG
jgi:hypothetical protein